MSAASSLTDRIRGHGLYVYNFCKGWPQAAAVATTQFFDSDVLRRTMRFLNGVVRAADRPSRRRYYLALLLVLLRVQMHAQDGTWANRAVTDIRAIHDLIRDNHPGILNPEDPRFSKWLEKGERDALAETHGIKNATQYQLALRRYTNGFADGHVGIAFKESLPVLWPGFLTRTDTPDGPTRVSLVQEAPGVHVGDLVESCGRSSITALLTERVLLPRVARWRNDR